MSIVKPREAKCVAQGHVPVRDSWAGVQVNWFLFSALLTGSPYLPWYSLACPNSGWQWPITWGCGLRERLILCVLSEGRMAIILLEWFLGIDRFHWTQTASLPINEQYSLGTSWDRARSCCWPQLIRISSVGSSNVHTAKGSPLEL